MYNGYHDTGRSNYIQVYTFAKKRGRGNPLRKEVGTSDSYLLVLIPLTNEIKKLCQLPALHFRSDRSDQNKQEKTFIDC
jgi:hypothetical protein